MWYFETESIVNPIYTYAREKKRQYQKKATSYVKIRRYQVELEGLARADDRIHKRVEHIRGQIKRLRA